MNTFVREERAYKLNLPLTHTHSEYFTQDTGDKLGTHLSITHSQYIKKKKKKAEVSTSNIYKNILAGRDIFHDVEKPRCNSALQAFKP